MTPTEDLDGVAASLTTSLVVVDTALIVEEVFVDGEGELSGAVVVELSLDARDCEGVNDGT